MTIFPIERLPEAAAQFIETFGLGAGKGAGRVFAFYAPMGAGKTTFISEVCRQLGSPEEAASPTFSIANEYDTPKAGTVFHLDCYRIDSEEEAFETGVEEYFNSGALCFVEWPGNIEGLLPEDTVKVEIGVLPDGSRRIDYEGSLD